MVDDIRKNFKDLILYPIVKSAEMLGYTTEQIERRKDLKWYGNYFINNTATILGKNAVISGFEAVFGLISGAIKTIWVRPFMP
jgi:hypothetical protein